MRHDAGLFIGFRSEGPFLLLYLLALLQGVNYNIKVQLFLRKRRSSFILEHLFPLKIG